MFKQKKADVRSFTILLAVSLTIILFYGNDVGPASAAEPQGSPSRISLSRVVTMQPQPQIMVERSDFEKHVNLNWEKVNDTLYTFTAQIDPLLLSNITTCIAKPAGQRIGCFVDLRNFTDDEGQRIYDFDALTAAARIIAGDLSSYPVRNLSGRINIDRTSMNIAAGQARFNITFPQGLEDGQRFGLGFSSVNVSVVNSSEIIITNPAVTATANFLPAVNRNSSILFVSVRQNTTQARKSQATCFLNNVSGTTSSSVTCNIQDTPFPTPLYIKWQIIEFNQGVTVQHGTSNNTGTTTVSKTEVINEVNVSNSFIIYAGGNNLRSDNKQAWASFEFQNSTEIRINTAERTTNVSYQVVSMEGARVFTGNKTVANTETDILFNLTSPINRSRSFIIAANVHSGGTVADVGSRNFMGVIVNETQIKLTRGVPTNPGDNLMNATWQLVELPAGNTVWNYTVNFSESETIQNVTIASVNLNQSVVFASSQSGQSPMMGITVHNASDRAGLMYATAALKTSTLLEINRSPSTTNANVSNFTYFVVQFDQSGASAPASDTTSPTYTSLDVNNTGAVILDDVLFSVKGADETALGQYIFAWNGTGLSCNVWANDTSSAFGTDGWANVTKNIPAACIGKTHMIGFQYFLTDTSNNKNSTAMRIINTTDDTPPTCTWSQPPSAAVVRSGNASLIVVCTDPEPNVLTYHWHINGTFNKTTTGNTTINFTKGNYVANVSAFDGDYFSPNVSRTFDLSSNVTTHQQIQFINISNQHTTNISAAFTSPDGASDIVNYSVSTTAGACSQVSNSSSGNVRNFTFNCTGTGLTAYTATVTVNNTRQNNSKAAASSIYPNNAPPAPTITSPSNNGYVNTANHTIAYNSTDSDSDTITYRIYVQAQLNQTLTANTSTLNLSDSSTNIINISAYDGAQYSSNTTVNYTVDTTSPIIENASVVPASATKNNPFTVYTNYSEANVAGINVTIAGANHTMTCTASTGQCQLVFTNTSAAGNYPISTFYILDLAGNRNTTTSTLSFTAVETQEAVGGTGTGGGGGGGAGGGITVTQQIINGTIQLVNGTFAAKPASIERYDAYFPSSNEPKKWKFAVEANSPVQSCLTTGGFQCSIGGSNQEIVQITYDYQSSKLTKTFEGVVTLIATSGGALFKIPVKFTSVNLGVTLPLDVPGLQLLPSAVVKHNASGGSAQPRLWPLALLTILPSIPKANRWVSGRRLRARKAAA